MYKILVVEDEAIMRDLLSTFIDWQQIGFQISGAEENGQKALKFIQKNEVDVVITDIRMPVMGGLELASKLKTAYPEIKTILISAHSDFEYARQAIGYGVYGYLLKSDEEEEFTKYFAQLKEVLDAEKEAGFEALDQEVGQTSEGMRKITREALLYIQKNYSRDISLNSLAAYVNVHPVHISRLLSQEAGKSFIDILTETRVKASLKLLEDERNKIYEIAEAVGYKKPSYFSETFKKVMGMTPAEYRDGGSNRKQDAWHLRKG